jgi:hypothetical protein
MYGDMDELTVEKALDMIDVVDGTVHVFTGNGILVGSTWDLPDVVAHFKERGCSRAGPTAEMMKHAVHSGGYFFATKDVASGADRTQYAELTQALEDADDAKRCIAQNRGYDKELAKDAYLEVVGQVLAPALIAALDLATGDLSPEAIVRLAKKLVDELKKEKQL